MPGDRRRRRRGARPSGRGRALAPGHRLRRSGRRGVRGEGRSLSGAPASAWRPFRASERTLSCARSAAASGASSAERTPRFEARTPRSRRLRSGSVSIREPWPTALPRPSSSRSSRRAQQTRDANVRLRHPDSARRRGAVSWDVPGLRDGQGRAHQQHALLDAARGGLAVGPAPESIDAEIEFRDPAMPGRGPGRHLDLDCRRLGTVHALDRWRRPLRYAAWRRRPPWRGPRSRRSSAARRRGAGRGPCPRSSSAARPGSPAPWPGRPRGGSAGQPCRG